MNFSFDTVTVSIAVLAAALVVFSGAVISLHIRLKKFLVGSKTENLSQSINGMAGSIKELEAFKTELEGYLVSVEKRLKKSVQAIHTVRFNPFKGSGSGGNQSFATAFLNENGDGVVVSSLYAREHISIFSKPVKKGLSEFELSEEEKEAISGAMKML